LRAPNQRRVKFAQFEYTVSVPVPVLNSVPNSVSISNSVPVPNSVCRNSCTFLATFFPSSGATVSPSSLAQFVASKQNAGQPKRPTGRHCFYAFDAMSFGDSCTLLLVAPCPRQTFARLGQRQASQRPAIGRSEWTRSGGELVKRSGQEGGRIEELGEEVERRSGEKVLKVISTLFPSETLLLAPRFLLLASCRKLGPQMMPNGASLALQFGASFAVES